MKSKWAERADAVLAGLFGSVVGQPTRQQLIEAYPFGERRYWPYKVWLRRVKAFKAARRVGLTWPLESWNRRSKKKIDPRQMEIEE